MNYEQCKQVLYNSQEMENIPDRWKMEVPIIFNECGKQKIGYLFSAIKDGKAKLKTMLGVSIEDGKVTKYSIEKLRDNFQVNIQELDAISIKDYDLYFEQKEEQESIICNLVNGETFSKERLLQVTKELFSSKQYEEIVIRIGGEFYKQ